MHGGRWAYPTAWPKVRGGSGRSRHPLFRSRFRAVFRQLTRARACARLRARAREEEPRSVLLRLRLWLTPFFLFV